MGLIHMRSTFRPDPAQDSKGFHKEVDISDGGLMFRVECGRSAAAYDILSRQRYFYTPALKGCDEASGVIFFEKIVDMEPISADLDEIWFCRIGELLAIIHNELRLPKEITIVRQKDKDVKGLVYIHGDFMPNNLCLSRGKLTVFDWGVRPWANEIYTMASPAVDIAAFIAPWWVPRWWDFGFPADKLKAFFKVYLQTIGTDSIIAHRARITLEEELEMHKGYHHKEILKRPRWKRQLHKIKMHCNIFRTKHGILHVR